MDAAHGNVIAASYELRAASLKAEKSFIALRAELCGGDAVLLVHDIHADSLIARKQSVFLSKCRASKLEARSS